jgi:hypothetical protein
VTAVTRAEVDRHPGVPGGERCDLADVELEEPATCDQAEHATSFLLASHPLSLFGPIPVEPELHTEEEETAQPKHAQGAVPAGDRR